MTSMKRGNKTSRQARGVAAGAFMAFASVALGAATSPAALAAPTAGAFHPLSVTFVSLSTGWALGTVPCKNAGACLALSETTNAGHSWQARPLPARLAAQADRTVTNGVPKGTPGSVSLPAALYGSPGLEVRFANRLDGWIYGGLPISPSSEQAVLWSTHNGGTSWRQIPVLPGKILAYSGDVLDLEATSGTAYLMAPNNSGSVTVESSPISSDSWHIDSTPPLGNPAGGGQQEGAFVFQGGKGWLVEGNNRSVAGSAELVGNGKWSSWAAPCSKVGNSFSVPTAPSATNLAAVCQMGGFAFPLPKSAPKGATLGSYWLYFSTNGGKTFSAGPKLGDSGYQFNGIIASPKAGTIFLGSGSTGLVGSFNGGRSWASSYKGDFFYVGFTSESQGVGLLRTSASNAASTEMVMTFDAGRHWARVTF